MKQFIKLPYAATKAQHEILTLQKRNKKPILNIADSCYRVYSNASVGLICLCMKKNEVVKITPTVQPQPAVHKKRTTAQGGHALGI